MEVEIIVDVLEEEEKKDSLEARIVKEQIKDLEVEFEHNGVPARVIWRYKTK